MPSADQVERFRRDCLRLGLTDERIGAAVSGGPDSLALLLIAAAAFPGRVAAATVDHGLRAESASEAAHVAAICASIGIPHKVLTVHVAGGGEGLQGEARRARYRALQLWAEAEGLGAVLTGHHADDQAETLLMRMARGAGLAGLAGVRAVRALGGNVRLARPLLAWRRTELEEIARPFAPVDDPSNRNPRFDRVRMRAVLRDSDAFDATALARSAAALAESEDALAWVAERLWRERAVQDVAGLELDVDDVPAELRRRLVVKALADVGGGAARGHDVQRLLGLLNAGKVATLAGVKCTGGARWRFEVAPPRSSRRA